MKKITEAILQRAIIDYLNYRKDLYWFRSAAGQVKMESGRVFRTGRPGVPDISVVFKGQYFGLEVKTDTGRQSDVQKRAQQDIEAAGGKYYIVRDMDELKGILTA
jgi:hypothetical protein